METQRKTRLDVWTWVLPKTLVLKWIYFYLLLFLFHCKNITNKTSGTFSRHLEVALAARTVKKAVYWQGTWVTRGGGICKRLMTFPRYLIFNIQYLMLTRVVKDCGIYITPGFTFNSQWVSLVTSDISGVTLSAICKCPKVRRRETTWSRHHLVEQTRANWLIFEGRWRHRAPGLGWDHRGRGWSDGKRFDVNLLTNMFHGLQSLWKNYFD